MTYSRLISYSPCSDHGFSLFLQRTLLPFRGKGYLETKIWAAGLLCATVVLLFLGLQRGRAKNRKHIHTYMIYINYLKNHQYL